MSKKVIALIVGALVFYAVQFLVSFATGPLIHDGVLADDYQANSEYWRPELNQDPPDMAALMPTWILNGLISSLVLTGVFLWIRGGFKGPSWLKGVKFGVVLSLIAAMYCLGWSGIFNLPGTIWTWWAIEGPFYYLPAGAALGWVTGKLAPE